MSPLGRIRQKCSEDGSPATEWWAVTPFTAQKVRGGEHGMYTLGMFSSSLSLSLHTHEMGVTVTVPLSGLAEGVNGGAYVKLSDPAWYKANASRCVHWLLDAYLMTEDERAGPGRVGQTELLMELSVLPLRRTHYTHWLLLMKGLLHQRKTSL